jgi:hypothetical protein
MPKIGPEAYGIDKLVGPEASGIDKTIFLCLFSKGMIFKRFF